jgi:hypothetical protein
MNIEHLDQLPDGKTELPATVTVNKLRGDVQLNFKVHLTLKGFENIKNRVVYTTHTEVPL